MFFFVSASFEVWLWLVRWDGKPHVERVSAADVWQRFGVGIGGAGWWYVMLCHRDGDETLMFFSESRFGCHESHESHQRKMRMMAFQVSCHLHFTPVRGEPDARLWTPAALRCQRQCGVGRCAIARQFTISCGAQHDKLVSNGGSWGALAGSRHLAASLDDSDSWCSLITIFRTQVLVVDDFWNCMQLLCSCSTSFIAANVSILNSGKSQRGVERRGILLARADGARNFQQAERKRLILPLPLFIIFHHFLSQILIMGKPW